METNKEESLQHYGMPRRSGRYPYGSGEDPYQHEDNILGSIDKLKREGLSEKEIASQLGMTVSKMRKEKSLAAAEQRDGIRRQAIALKEKNWSNAAIAEKLGLAGESSVRSLLNEHIAERQRITQATSEVIRDKVDKAKYVDIGSGSEALLGVSKTKLDTAVQKLVKEGYKIQYLSVEQLGVPGNKTSIKVLTPPEVSWKELNNNKEKIELLAGYKSEDGGRTFAGIEPPSSVDSSRLQIRYPSQGGATKDGIIEIRRGLNDLNLGNASYAQVRIAVDGSHYLKGIAVYADDLPPGIDIRFNTSKPDGTPMMAPNKNDTQVLKPLKKDKDNPFGSSLKMDDGVIVGQKHYIDADGKSKLSPINIVREEGDWNEWSSSLASQMLSKQPVPLAKRQLKLASEAARDEFNDIMSIQQPEVKRSLLEAFAQGCDSDAVELKAAALPRQATKVILPVNGLKDNEIYAPSYKNGEEVVLVRYPHGGIFEMPRLIVNNKSKDGEAIMGKQPIDAVGISSKTASILSGADFDGDTVLVIPTKNTGIKNMPPLKGLEGFDHIEQYKAYEGMPEMKSKTKQLEMGKITNLITDMTIKGANEDELARAVRHSMVIIDAEKHYLNYKQSYVDNNIAELKEKYQGGVNKGASTLISKASSEARVPARKELSPNPETGERRWEYVKDSAKPDDAFYSFRKENKDGSTTLVTREKTAKSTKMAEVSDAYELSSGSKMESVYADYANTMKAMANMARKEAMAIKNTSYDPSARKIYQAEVDSLNHKLNIAIKNSPLERKAQTLANVWIDAKKKSNPDLKTDNEALKKVKNQCLAEARLRVGAKKIPVSITDREWEAIMSGALSSTKLKAIFANTPTDTIRRLATPRQATELAASKQQRIKTLSANGYSISEIASQLGVSTSTVSKYVKDNKGLS